MDMGWLDSKTISFFQSQQKSYRLGAGKCAVVHGCSWPFSSFFAMDLPHDDQPERFHHGFPHRELPANRSRKLVHPGGLVDKPDLSHL